MKKSLTCIALLLFAISVVSCTYEKHMIPDGKGGMIEEKRRKGSEKVEYERVSPKPVKVDYDD
jgi:hypothetical protein